jgi:hypothetical protein
MALEKMGIVALLLYIIHVLVGLLRLKAARKTSVELTESAREEIAERNRSRDLIFKTANTTDHIEDRQKENCKQLSDMAAKTAGIYEVVTAKINGTPLVYNPELHAAIVNLNNNIRNQTAAIDRLAKGI